MATRLKVPGPRRIAATGTAGRLAARQPSFRYGGEHSYPTTGTGGGVLATTGYRDFIK
jgi:hypothetical protein